MSWYVIPRSSVDVAYGNQMTEAEQTPAFNTCECPVCMCFRENQP